MGVVGVALGLASMVVIKEPKRDRFAKVNQKSRKQDAEVNRQK
jgi:hypothetical protein